MRPKLSGSQLTGLALRDEEGELVQTVQWPDRAQLPLSTYLEQAAIILVYAADSRNREILAELLRTFLAPKIELWGLMVHFEELGCTYDREDYINYLLAYSNEYNFQVEAQNVSALVNETKGIANVFVTLLERGTAEKSDALSIESVLLFTWKRKEQYGQPDEWLATRLEVIRGPGSHWLR